MNLKYSYLINSLFVSLLTFRPWKIINSRWHVGLNKAKFMWQRVSHQSSLVFFFLDSIFFLPFPPQFHICCHKALLHIFFQKIMLYRINLKEEGLLFSAMKQFRASNFPVVKPDTNTEPLNDRNEKLRTWPREWCFFFPVGIYLSSW